MNAPRVVISIYDDFDNPHYAGGGPAVVRAVAARLARDCDVLVVTGGRRWRRLDRGGIHHLQLPVVWAGPRLGQAIWALMLPFVAVLLRYDAWIESFTPPLSSNLLPLVTRRPVIGLAQALSGREMARRYGTRVPLLLERRLLRRYRDIVVLNARDRDAVQEFSSAVRVHLIPNVVPAPPRTPPDVTEGTYALFLGRIDITQKGLDLLLEAYSGPGAERLLPLVVAGAGRPQEEEKLRELVVAAGPRVQWIGSVHGQEKEDLLAGCAFLVVSSREESFSLAALEAMARGRPVVRFDLPQLDWIAPECGEVVASFEVDSLREAMVSMSTDVGARSLAGAAAAEHAQEHVGLHRLDKYRRLVRDTLDADGSCRQPRHRAGELTLARATAHRGRRPGRR
ncbi:glycosyltransferase family 4 protein [Kineococcus sp. TBRC 1896]|uniref:Glycosyltransferase family 4 protein n=1 Tax=Kineococcus mangrovi TaxID=1660183 RepID=A0ABV4HWX5_9ACTN